MSFAVLSDTKTEKTLRVLEGHRRLCIQRPDDGLDPHGLRAPFKCTKRSPRSSKRRVRRPSSLKTIQLTTEKIIQREKDRAECRKDRERSDKVAAVAEGGQGDRSKFEQHELFVWDHNANARCGGFVAAAIKRSQDED